MPGIDQGRRSVIADERGRHPVYLIGPSSVGKSYLGEAVALELGVKSRDSDHELKEPGLPDWPKVRAWLDALDGTAVIVDIGAGTQYSCGDELTVYLGGRRDRVILIIDDPHAGFARNVSEGHRTEGEWENYREVEIRAPRGSVLPGFCGHRLSGDQAESGPCGPRLGRSPSHRRVMTPSTARARHWGWSRLAGLERRSVAAQRWARLLGCPTDRPMR